MFSRLQKLPTDGQQLLIHIFVIDMKNNTKIIKNQRKYFVHYKTFRISIYFVLDLATPKSRFFSSGKLKHSKFKPKYSTRLNINITKKIQ